MNILLKFSGEFFSPKDELTSEGIFLANAMAKLGSGYVVVGGGNRIRGRDSSLPRNASDRLGVISTLFNSFVLQEYLIFLGLKAIVFSPFHDFGVFYSPKLAMEAFADGAWVILAGGLGTVGFVSTDLSSVIKSLELQVDAFVKVTKVEGIFDRSPDLPGAKLLSTVSYHEVLQKNLVVMDLAAMAIACDNELPIGVCSVSALLNFLQGGRVGTVVGYDWRG